MAAAITSRVPLPLSLYTFRSRKSKQSWPLLKKELDCFFVSIPKHSNCDIKLSYNVKPGWGFSLNCAHGTFAPVGPSETEGDSRRSRTSLGKHNSEEGYQRELEELFEEVKSMIVAGEEDNAADLLRANYESVKERVNSGAKGMEEAALIDVLALGYMALGDLKLVGSLLGQLSEVVDGLKDDEQLLDPVLVHMASMYSNLRKFEKSALVFQRAIGIMESKYGENSVFLVTPYLGIAKVYGSTGKATKAFKFYHRAITILESSRGTESEDLITPLFSLGNLSLQEGKAKEAEASFLRIKNIHTKIYGEHDGRVGMAMCSLARAKCVSGKVDEAIRLYRKALQVIENSNSMSMDDNIREKIRTDLAELLHVVGRGKEGRELLEESMLITEKNKGKEHPSLAMHMINLATSYLRSKNYAEAERLLRTSLQIMAKTLRSDDQAMTFPMLHLAITLYHLRRDEEAEQIAMEVLNIREKAFGEDSLPVAEALDCLVSIQKRLAMDDKTLLEKLRRVLVIQEREFGDESVEVLETLKKVAFYLDKLGRKDEKLSFQKRLSILELKFNNEFYTN